MAATGGTGGLGALPLAGVGAAVVVVGGAVMAWLGVFDSDDVRRIVDRASSEENSVVISPSAKSPVITEGLSLQPDPVASDAASDPASVSASDQVADQAGDVVAAQSEPQGEQPPAQVQQTTPQVAAPVAPQTEPLPEGNATAAEASEDSGAVVSATGEAEVNPVPAPSELAPVPPAKTAGPDEQATDAQLAAAEEPGSSGTGDLAQVKTETANGSVEAADTRIAQGYETVPEAPGLEAPRLDLVRVDPTGQTVIAGRAAQGVQVSILLDGEVLEKVDVQPGGDFVSLTSIRPSATARVISLRAEADGQQSLSETSFILAPVSQVPAMAVAESTPPPAALAADDVVSKEAASEDVASEDVASEAVSEAVSEEAAIEDVAVADKTVSSETANESSTADASDPVTSAEQRSDPVTSVLKTGEKPVDAGPSEGTTASAAANTPAEAAEEGIQTVSVAEQSAGAQSETAPVASIAPADVTTQAPQAAAPSAVVSEPDTNLRTAETTALSQPDATSAGTTEAQADAEEQPAPRPEATQVAVLRADADGVVLVQPVAEQPQGKVVLDTISYSDSGEVQLAGRARAEARVLVYLDNASAGQFTAGSNGSWGGGLEAVVPGVYTLRLDEVNAEGKVLSRLETPFKREAPEVLRPPVTDEAGQGAAAPLVRAVTVQKGDTLWAISQQRYGSGFLYVRVFAANQDAIRDPDLIYPGQVFAIPE